MKIKQLVSVLLLTGIIQTVRAAVVDTINIPSSKMHRSYKCVVITPASYQTGIQRYPVVYLLHGFSGNYADWIQKAPAIRELADTYQCMLVCPDGAYSSWYVDSPVDSTMCFETYVATEIPEYIDRHYQTLPEPQYRAIAGLSMGGHGALYLAIRHPEIFGAAGSMSGGVDIRPFPDNWDIAARLGAPGKQGANWNAYTIICLAEKVRPGTLSLIIDCGIKDFFINVNRDLHQQLWLSGIAHDYIERPGAHNWDYWSNAVTYQLLFFHQFFTKKTTGNNIRAAMH